MKTIAILSQKGGTGKTTLALHLAVEAERSGAATLIVDLDPQASASSWSDSLPAASHSSSRRSLGDRGQRSTLRRRSARPQPQGGVPASFCRCRPSARGSRLSSSRIIHTYACVHVPAYISVHGHT